MKKVTTLFDKRLQQLLAHDEEFKRIPVLKHALAVTQFVVELSATGIVPAPQFPILNCDFKMPEVIRLTESELKLFTESYKASGRIEAHIRPGAIPVCLAIDIYFYGKGRKGFPLLIVHAAADSMAIRKFNVDKPTSTDLQQLYEKGRQERQSRDIKDAETRSLDRVGP